MHEDFRVCTSPQNRVCDLVASAFPVENHTGKWWSGFRRIAAVEIDLSRRTGFRSPEEDRAFKIRRRKLGIEGRNRSWTVKARKIRQRDSDAPARPPGTCFNQTRTWCREQTTTRGRGPASSNASKTTQPQAFPFAVERRNAYTYTHTPAALTPSALKAPEKGAFFACAHRRNNRRHGERASRRRGASQR